MNTDNTSILANILKRSIVVVEPCSRKNGVLNIDFIIYMPLRGNKSRSKRYRLILEKDFSMYYITNSRIMNRVYINIPELIKNDELIAMQFYRIHCERLLVKDSPAKEPA